MKVREILNREVPIPIGLTWGEEKKKIILNELDRLYPQGLPVENVLSLMQKYVYKDAISRGENPANVDDVVCSDDVSFTLLELIENRAIEIKKDLIYFKYPDFVKWDRYHKAKNWGMWIGPPPSEVSGYIPEEEFSFKE